MRFVEETARLQKRVKDIDQYTGMPEPIIKDFLFGAFMASGN